MIDDAEILAAVDSVWLTVPAIHKRLHYRGLAHELSRSLRRLAAAGRIDSNSRPTSAPHYRTGSFKPDRTYAVHCYRRVEPGEVEPIVTSG